MILPRAADFADAFIFMMITLIRDYFRAFDGRFSMLPLMLRC